MMQRAIVPLSKNSGALVAPNRDPSRDLDRDPSRDPERDAARDPSAAKLFSAILVKDDYPLGWIVAHLPFDPRATWAHMVRLRVAGRLNGCAFRSSLFAQPGGGTFFLLVNRTLQTKACVGLGSQVEFSLWPDLELRPAELPGDLEALLDEEEGLRAWYDRLSESTRREIGKWVLGVKSVEAQTRRAMQMAERLLATMEAETSLPPLISTALRRRPEAQAGWKLMTETQRRNHLMGVFYYQAPEAQARRVTKLCQAAEARARTGASPSDE